MTNLERAINDGYAHILGEEGKQKITYVSSDNYVGNYSAPEEKVRAEFWAELIYKYEYPVNRIKVEVTVPDRLPTNRADIVVFRDDECKRPYVADLSYGNKNVHHEIGYAQGLNKKVLLLYQIRDGVDAESEIGSNISMHDQVRYKNQTELRPELLKRIRHFYGIEVSD